MVLVDPGQPGSITNTATVAGNETDPDVDNGSSSHTTPLLPNAITVIKEASPEGPANFFFTTSGTGLSDFSLIDDGSGTNLQTFSDLSPGTFAIRETVPSGWVLETLACTSSGTGTSAAVDMVHAPATITLATGGTVTCVFTRHGDTDTAAMGPAALNLVLTDPGYLAVSRTANAARANEHGRSNPALNLVVLAEFALAGPRAGRRRPAPVCAP